MKITSIQIIDNASALKTFNWKSEKPVNIFIGENGSGKTTILKNLVWIFRAAHDLFVNKKKTYSIPSFSFTIEYEVIIPNAADNFDFETNYVGVKLYSTPESKNFCEIISDNGKYTLDEIIRKFGYQALLPSNIVAYYAGWDDKIKSIFTEVEEDYKDKMIEDEKSKIENGYSIADQLPLIYLEKINFQILFATLFSFEYNLELENYLKNKFLITSQETYPINIILKRPNESFYNSDFNTFWGAKGELRKFLDVLKEFNGEQLTYDTISQTLVISFNLSQWIKIREFYGTEKRIYYLLHLLNSSGFLSGVQTYFNKENKVISNFNLSEGEQQLLTLIGIREVLLEQNSLILLDEPDTFLHPIWQQNFIGELIENMTAPKGGDFLPFHNEPNFFVTTHSLNLLNNADKDFVKVTMMQNGQEVNLPLKFYGKKISHINYNLMNVTERPKKFQTKIDQLFEYIDLELLADGLKLYSELASDLGSDDDDLLRAKIELDFLKADSDGKSD